MSERTKLIIYGAAAAFFLLLAALLPLAFSGNAETAETELNEGERAALFADYWGGTDENVTALAIEQPGSATEQFCNTRMDELISLCSFDNAEGELQSSGSEYLLISDGTEELRVCRKWQQLQGDWRGWLDICFDMDTGEVYYLYLSSECLKNKTEYQGALPSGLDAEYVAEYVDENSDYELISLSWSGETGEEAAAIYKINGSAVIMKISCIYYESTLVDIKITCA